jgi:hypothetical protein
MRIVTVITIATSLKFAGVSLLVPQSHFFVMDWWSSNHFCSLKKQSPCSFFVPSLPFVVNFVQRMIKLNIVCCSA